MISFLYSPLATQEFTFWTLNFRKFGQSSHQNFIRSSAQTIALDFTAIVGLDPFMKFYLQVTSLNYILSISIEKVLIPSIIMHPPSCSSKKRYKALNPKAAV